MLKMYKKTRCHLCNVQKHKNHEFFFAFNVDIFNMSSGLKYDLKKLVYDDKI